MSDVAIIAGAGWKCGGAGVKDIPPQTDAISLPLTGCPEMLLPLGNGTTVISRLSSQLRKRGFTIFIGVAPVGYTYPSATYFVTYKKRRYPVDKGSAQIGLSVEVWTQERLDYVAKFGTTFFGPDPDKSNINSTLLAGIDRAGPDWDRWLLLPGDMMFSDALLDEIIAWPCSCALWLGDLALWLNAEGIGHYRELTRGRLGGKSKHHAISEKAWLVYPHRHGDALAKRGIKFLSYEEVGPHGREAGEIDSPGYYYPKMLEQVKKFG